MNKSRHKRRDSGTLKHKLNLLMQDAHVKKNLARFGILFLAVVSGAMADQFNWGNTYAQAWQGFGTSPYAAINTATNVRLTILCLDYNDEVGPPYTWNANVWTLNQQDVQTEGQYGGNYNNLLNAAYQVAHPGQQAPNQISGAPFAFQTDGTGQYAVNLSGSPDAYTRYLEAAWLFTELLDAGGNTQLGLISQVAAWDLFVNSNNIQDLRTRISNTGGTYAFQDLVDPTGKTVPSVSGLNFEQAVDYALSAAQQAVVTNKTFTGLGWSLVTGDPTWVESSDGKTIPVQEFLTPTTYPSRDLAPAPEPASFVLLGTIAGAALWVKRRKTA